MKGRITSELSDRPLVIFQMGKVGSTSLAKAIGNPVYQVHTLRAERIQAISRQLESNGLGFPVHLRQSMLFLERHMPLSPGTKFICPIRKPLDRNISAFFQQLSMNILISPTIRKGLKIGKSAMKIGKLPIPFEWKCLMVELLFHNSIEKNMEFLLDRFANSFNHLWPENWIDHELMPVYGLDIWRQPFPTEEGFSLYEHKQIQLIIFQSELPNDYKTDILSSFIGKRIDLDGHQHNTRNKKLRKAYDVFREKITEDGGLLECYHTSKFHRHFYGTNSDPNNNPK